MPKKSLSPEAKKHTPSSPSKPPLELVVFKRNGNLVPFREKRIFHALEAAFRDTKKVKKGDPLSVEILDAVREITQLVVERLGENALKGASFTVEGIQDLVEVTLMNQGHHDVARDYIIYRDHHKQLREDSPQSFKVVRKDGTEVRFHPMKVAGTIEQAFRSVGNFSGLSPDWIVQSVNLLTQKVISKIGSIHKKGEVLNTTRIRDEIEQQLMKEGFFKEAKWMILQKAGLSPVQHEEVVRKEVSQPQSDNEKLKNRITHACRGFEKETNPDELLEMSLLNFYEGIQEQEIDQALIMAARAQIERDPAYSKVAARLLLDVIYKETIQADAEDPNLQTLYRKYFTSYIHHGIEIGRLSKELLDFDLQALAQAIEVSRDDQFHLLGLQTLYDRYFIHENQRRLEAPQIFWMRVSMGLAIHEKEKTKRAIEFYNTLSKFLYSSATPTLFNSGTPTPQLSSCYLSTVSDDLEHIFKTISDDAKLSKWAGGLGNDWTNVRAMGSKIKGTNGSSQGVIPFLKVANDTALAVNQGGKRKGSLCCYLETWHLDIEDFLELRKNTGDERRRTHDMHTANWIPDVFMKRVLEEKEWTLFSPDDVPDLHDLTGAEFEKRYETYEKMAENGEITLFKKVEALTLWRKMLSMLFETGHPWITFKDPSNIRSTQSHKGVVHSSNLCTEILLNTSEDETAVCNLGSINLAAHTTEKGLDKEKLKKTIETAIRMLDNVIDINYYPIAEAKNANMRHRPIGLGIMGFQDALYLQGISYASHEAVSFADQSMEFISYYALLASSSLAKERGAYSSFAGSKWDQGLLPIDTIDLLDKERGREVEMDRTSSMDWEVVRESIRKYGMRNSNTMAIAPTATISNIMGVTQSIEPTYRHLFVKSNLSGEFTLLNFHLVDRLKKLSLWDDEMIDDLKYFDGTLEEIDRIPQEVKELFPSAFEIAPDWLIECGSRRQKWLDMGQSLNLYLYEPSGKKLHEMYLYAWAKGLKTTYYTRTLAATQVEKSTSDINKRRLQPRWMKSQSASSNIRVEREESKPIVCNLDEGCESCQ